jgi:DNA-binding protein YbaB
MTWDAAALQTEITKAVEEYHALLATERVTAETAMVTAVMRLDGALLDVLVDPRAMRDEHLGRLLTDAIRAAEREVAGRRAALAATVTFLGHPVLDVVEEMINDPAAAVRRFAGEPVRRQAWAS